MADVELRAQFIDGASEGIAHVADSLKELGAAYLGFEGIKKLVENITEAQESILELDRLFRSFGDTVNVSKQDMIDYATAIQESTALTDDAVLKGQAALLKYTSITGEEFKRVRDIAVDLGAEMGGDVAGAADLLGRALENPLQGLRILRQLGIVLSPEQQELAKNMIETGRAAQVQAFLLEELEKRLKGTAKEGAETLGGALTQLKNALSDAFKGQGADVDGLTKSIKTLSEEVSKPEFREVLGDLVKLFVGLTTILARTVGLMGEFISKIQELSANSKAIRVLTNLIPGVGALRGLGDIADLIANKSGGTKGGSSVVPGQGDDGGLRSFLSKIYGKGGGLSGPILETPEEAKKRRAKELQDLIDSIQADVDLFNKADDATKTVAEKNEAAINEFIANLKIATKDITLSNQEAIDRGIEFLQEDLDNAAKNASARRVTLPKEEITEYQRLARDAAKSIQSAFADMFYNMGQGANNFLKDMLNVFKRILAEALALDLAKALKLDQLGKAGGGGSGGGGSVFGSILGGVIGAFFGHAGGTSQLSGPAIVGERGPELFIPPGFGGSIVPNYALGGTGVNYSPITNISAAPETDMSKLSAIISINNDRQRAEIMRMLYDNGFGRMR